jgi:hypothetical protein
MRRVLKSVILGAMLFTALTQPASAARDKHAQPPPPPPVERTTADGPEPDDTIIRMPVSPDGKTLYIMGELELGSFRKFIRVLNTAPKVRTIFLNSPGGIVLEGFMIAAIVRDRKMTTYVETSCASACTEILVAGAERIAHPGARIGFHQSHAVATEEKEEEEETPVTPQSEKKNMDEDVPSPPDDFLGEVAADSERDFLFERPFVQTGIDQAFIDRAFSTPSDSMWYPNPAEMLAARVLTKAVSDGATGPPAGFGLSRPAMADFMLKIPFWQLLKDKQPNLYEEQLSETASASQLDTPLPDALVQARKATLDELSYLSKTAADEIVDTLAVLQFDQITTSPSAYFSSCAKGDNIKPHDQAIALLPFEAREYAVMTQLLQSGVRRKPPSSRDAQKAIDRLMAAYLLKADYGDQAFICRYATSMIKSIGTLPREKRIKAFRAMLVIADEP